MSKGDHFFEGVFVSAGHLSLLIPLPLVPGVILSILSSWVTAVLTIMMITGRDCRLRDGQLYIPDSAVYNDWWDISTSISVIFPIVLGRSGGLYGVRINKVWLCICIGVPRALWAKIK